MGRYARGNHTTILLMILRTFKEVVKIANENHQLAISGKRNSIPYPLDNFNKLLRGMIRGNPIIVTASSGIGKTIITKALYVIPAINYALQTGIKLKIFYLAMEESREEFVSSLIANLIRKHQNKVISAFDILSYGEVIMTQKDVENLSYYEEYFNQIDQILEIIDYSNNPDKVKEIILNYLRQHGIEEKNADGEVIAYSYYDPTHNVMIVADHISLFRKAGLSLHETMTYWSYDISRQLFGKIYKCIPIHVQQQSAEKEKIQYTNKGETIEDKMKASLDGLADNKLTQRDAALVLGVFSPDRYGIKYYGGYPIEQFGDRIRFISVLKHRWGQSNTIAPIFFDGASLYLQSLPLAEQLTQSDYAKIKNNLLNP